MFAVSHVIKAMATKNGTANTRCFRLELYCKHNTIISICYLYINLSLYFNLSFIKKLN